MRVVADNDIRSLADILKLRFQGSIFRLCYYPIKFTTTYTCISMLRGADLLSALFFEAQLFITIIYMLFVKIVFECVHGYVYYLGALV